MSEPDVIIYTDGGADPNPGPGGWGVVMIDAASGEVRELSGGEGRTTNNRMELTAALRALEALEGRQRVRLFTDSQYLRRGITEWLPAWQRAGWKRKGGALANVDLWQALAVRIRDHRIDWQWVKGHAGNRWNERADALATAAIRGRRPAKAAAAAVEADISVYLAVSCPGPAGGWAALVRHAAGAESVIGDRLRPVTPPRLEVLAAAAVLAALPAGASVAFYTPSDYLRNGASRWLAGWRRNGWKTKSGTPVKNRDAWERLEDEMDRRKVQWPPVKGALPPELEGLEREARKQLAGG